MASFIRQKLAVAEQRVKPKPSPAKKKVEAMCNLAGIESEYKSEPNRPAGSDEYCAVCDCWFETDGTFKVYECPYCQADVKACNVCTQHDKCGNDCPLDEGENDNEDN